jgi:hypothetical protein
MAREKSILLARRFGLGLDESGTLVSEVTIVKIKGFPQGSK